MTPERERLSRLADDILVDCEQSNSVEEFDRIFTESFVNKMESYGQQRADEASKAYAGVTQDLLAQKAALEKRVEDLEAFLDRAVFIIKRIVSINPDLSTMIIDSRYFYWEYFLSKAEAALRQGEGQDGGKDAG